MSERKYSSHNRNKASGFAIYLLEPAPVPSLACFCNDNRQNSGSDTKNVESVWSCLHSLKGSSMSRRQG